MTVGEMVASHEDGAPGGGGELLGGKLSFDSVMKNKELAMRLVRERRCQIGRMARLRTANRVYGMEQEIQMRKRRIRDKVMRENVKLLNKIIENAAKTTFEGPKLEIVVKASFGEEVKMLVGLEDMSPSLMKAINMPPEVKEQVMQAQQLIYEVEEEQKKLVEKANRKLESMRLK